MAGIRTNGPRNEGCQDGSPHEQDVGQRDIDTWQGAMAGWSVPYAAKKKREESWWKEGEAKAGIKGKAGWKREGSSTADEQKCRSTQYWAVVGSNARLNELRRCKLWTELSWATYGVFGGGWGPDKRDTVTGGVPDSDTTTAAGPSRKLKPGPLERERIWTRGWEAGR